MARRKPLSKKQLTDPYLVAREAARKAKLEKQIADFLAWTAEHPSIHDRMPKSEP